jgi:hypothetical protein
MSMVNKIFAIATVLLAMAFAVAHGNPPHVRPRVSDLGLRVGILPSGPLDAITDVAGVEVGSTTIIRGDVVGETNDAYLNDIRGRHISPDMTVFNKWRTV